MADDAIPEPVDFDDYEDATRELCRHRFGTYYCMLESGHAGHHEAIGNRGSRRWSAATVRAPGHRPNE